MDISPLAGKLADPWILIDVSSLLAAYYTGRPDPSVPAERVAFGTSGHRGCSLDRSFNEAHILAIAQAICLYRKQQGIDGPLYIGIDTHTLSEPAFKSALEGSRRARPERRASTKFTRKVSRTGRTSTPYFAKPKRSWTMLSGEIVKAARLSPRRH